MAHFAKIEDGVVVSVLVVDNKDIQDTDGNEVEATGIAFLKNLFGDDAEWVQTSYNNNFRKQYAEVGGSYDAVKDKFIRSQPYPSWALDENDDWQAPKPRPELDKESDEPVCPSWDEDNLKWVLMKFAEVDGERILVVDEDN
jgi:hypothetical protein